MRFRADDMKDAVEVLTIGFMMRRTENPAPWAESEEIESERAVLRAVTETMFEADRMLTASEGDVTASVVFEIAAEGEDIPVLWTTNHTGERTEPYFLRNSGLEAIVPMTQGTMRMAHAYCVAAEASGTLRKELGLDVIEKLPGAHFKAVTALLAAVDAPLKPGDFELYQVLAALE
jgi:hypothetical protein